MKPLLRYNNACINDGAASSSPQVKMQVFLDYAKAVGLVLSVVICLLYGCQNAAAIGANVWLSDWTNDANQTRGEVNVRLGVYASLGMAQSEMSPRVREMTPGGPKVHPKATCKEYICRSRQQYISLWRIKIKRQHNAAVKLFYRTRKYGCRVHFICVARNHRDGLKGLYRPYD